MTLNKPKSHVLKGLVGDADVVFHLPFVSDTENDTFVDEVATWEAEYDVQNLYITNDDNGTSLFSAGVVGFPKPKKRS